MNSFWKHGTLWSELAVIIWLDLWTLFLNWTIFFCSRGLDNFEPLLGPQWWWSESCYPSRWTTTAGHQGSARQPPQTGEQYTHSSHSHTPTPPLESRPPKQCTTNADHSDTHFQPICCCIHANFTTQLRFESWAVDWEFIKWLLVERCERRCFLVWNEWFNFGFINVFVQFN